ncbi:MAG: nucleoside transporter C-terminal domain-containing protein [Pseudomonadota bacterium]
MQGDWLMGEVARALLGIGVFLALAWLLSENRRAINLRQAFGGLVMQIGLAIVLTQVPAVVNGIGNIARGVDRLQQSAQAGAVFVFGYLGGGLQPFEAVSPARSTFIFALQVVPAIFLVSALAAVLWHWGILRWIVRGAAWAFGKAFGVSGPVGVSTSACIFLGMVEAPLLVRPLLPKVSRGELFIIMVDGLSVIGGSTMILIGGLLAARIPGAFAQLLSATLISMPMAITMARIIIPGQSHTTLPQVQLSSQYKNSLDAVTQGTIGAVKIAAYVIALLIVFIGIIDLVDTLLALFWPAAQPVTLSTLLGTLLLPFSWLMGVPMPDLTVLGGLLGAKVAANEVVAYSQLIALPEDALSDKTIHIATYALGSFGNFGSVAILIGTLAAMAPERKDDIIALGIKALFAAFLTSCMTGSVIGILSTVFGQV